MSAGRCTRPEYKCQRHNTSCLKEVESNLGRELDHLLARIRLDDEPWEIVACPEIYALGKPLDVDVIEPGAVPCFMPEPGGPSVDDVERILLEVAAKSRVAGMGITGLAPGADPAVLGRLAGAAGL